jgi:hypothetical protein
MIVRTDTDADTTWHPPYEELLQYRRLGDGWYIYSIHGFSG